MDPVALVNLLVSAITAIKDAVVQYLPQIQTYLTGRRSQRNKDELARLSKELDKETRIDDAVDSVRRRNAADGSRVSDDWLRRGG